MRKIKLSVDYGVILNCCIWEPDKQPKGIVQIIHGVAEYAQRYDHFASFLTEHGFLVVAEDHPGHGETVTPDNLGYLTGGWMNAVNGVHKLYETIHHDYPDLPYYMLGHSMGSFLLRTYLFTYHSSISGAVISGTGWQPAIILPLGRLICKEEAARLGDASFSQLLNTMMFGGYNKKFSPQRTIFDWLSTDNAVVDKYIEDSLCGFPISIQLCTEMMKGLSMIQKNENLSRMQKELPIYFFSGEEDPVGDMGAGVHKTITAFQDAGMKDVSYKLYPGMRHEALNEIGKEQVYQDVLQWLECR